MDWDDIFRQISKNLGNTLTYLKLRLPMAKTEDEKEKTVWDSGGKFSIEVAEFKEIEGRKIG